MITNHLTKRMSSLDVSIEQLSDKSGISAVVIGELINFPTRVFKIRDDIASLLILGLARIESEKDKEYEELLLAVSRTGLPISVSGYSTGATVTIGGDGCAATAHAGSRLVALRDAISRFRRVADALPDVSDWPEMKSGTRNWDNIEDSTPVAVARRAAA